LANLSLKNIKKTGTVTLCRKLRIIKRY